MCISNSYHDSTILNLIPFNQLEQALESGNAVWTKLQLCDPSDLIPLLSLIIIIEQHIESLADLCILNDYNNKTSCEIIKRLISFYSLPEQPYHSSKRGPSLQHLLNLSNVPPARVLSNNYYDPLFDLLEDEADTSTPTMKKVIEENEARKPQPALPDKFVAATFPEDLGIAAVSTFMTRQQQEMSSDMEEEEPLPDEEIQEPPPTTTAILADKPPVYYRLRLNLIRHKYATPTDLTTLQLFKSFATAAKKTDKTLAFLPVDSTKQNLTSLVSQAHIDNLTPNQLRLYFSSWFKDQHHSISGFIHLGTNLLLSDFETKLPLAEWLQTYQYSVVLCKSQDEEMSIVGALCYGSLFLNRDSLLDSIVDHPSWLALNNDREKPIIIDLIIKPFRSPSKSSDMIFVRAERSKKILVQEFLLGLYDGTPKKYPRGDMLFFIPVTSKLNDDYTDEQRTKYLFNHLTYLGDEDCTAILGFADIMNEVQLKDSSIITVRTLLKSLPASPGMARNRLFQVVDLNASREFVIVTFQRCDKPYIEERKFELGKEILSHLAPGQASKVFAEELEGIQFVNAYHKQRGKVIRIQQPGRLHQEFVRHADSVLSSPPKKRPNPSGVHQSQAPLPLRPLQTNAVTYSGAVQAHTTKTRAVVQPDGTRTTTTTQMSQTVSAVMETRFQLIEQEQLHLKQRITGVENKATNISDNIQAMMAHWKITPVSYKRKPIGDPEDEGDMEHANHSMTAIQGTGDMHF